MKRALLPFYTFAAIFLAIVFVGVVAVPVVLSFVEKQYLELQSDINQRQAEALARFVEFRLAQSIPQEQVLSELNGMLSHADTDRGFSCVISRDTRRFISHPIAAIVGKPVASMGVEFESTDPRDPRIPMEEAIPETGSRSGTFHLPDSRREVVFMQSIPGTRWTISTHENTDRVDRELSNIRWKMIRGFVALGLLVAGPSAFAARSVSGRYEKIIEDRNLRILEEQAVAEKLLLNILPAPVAAELKAGRHVIAESHPDVSVLFADLVGFTPLAARIPPEELVGLLNRIFSAFDDIVDSHGLEKIKTIGDSYMVCGGLPDPSPGQLEQVADSALRMQRELLRINEETGQHFQLRIGIDTGTVVAGVIGKRKFAYDLWGDVVNTASRMESSAKPGGIHVTKTVEAGLRGSYRFEQLPDLEIKGKGTMATYRLVGKRLGGTASQ